MCLMADRRLRDAESDPAFAWRPCAEVHIRLLPATVPHHQLGTAAPMLNSIVVVEQDANPLRSASRANRSTRKGRATWRGSVVRRVAGRPGVCVQPGAEAAAVNRAEDAKEMNAPRKPQQPPGANRSTGRPGPSLRDHCRAPGHLPPDRENPPQAPRQKLGVPHEESPQVYLLKAAIHAAPDAKIA